LPKATMPVVTGSNGPIVTHPTPDFS
jgi:hypothetical protein